MKIVHTSDWHIGRDTGDVFESRNPSAEAEQLVNRFLVHVGRTGARMLVIAGNHDDPLRLDARSLLTELVNVQILGRPRPASRGGTRTIETRCGEKAVVAALPFASPGAWVSGL